MRNVILALLLVLSGCQGANLARISQGMTDEQVESQCHSTWPPTLLFSVEGDESTQTLTKTYRQNRGEVQVLIRVQEKAGVVESVNYLAY